MVLNILLPYRFNELFRQRQMRKDFMTEVMDQVRIPIMDEHEVGYRTTDFDLL